MPINDNDNDTFKPIDYEELWAEQLRQSQGRNIRDAVQISPEQGIQDVWDTYYDRYPNPYPVENRIKQYGDVENDIVGGTNAQNAGVRREKQPTEEGTQYDYLFTNEFLRGIANQVLNGIQNLSPYQAPAQSTFQPMDAQGIIQNTRNNIGRLNTQYRGAWTPQPASAQPQSQLALPQRSQLIDFNSNYRNQIPNINNILSGYGDTRLNRVLNL